MDKFVKPKSTVSSSATWMQKHVAVIGLVAIVVPITVGLLLVNTVFGNTPIKTSRRHTTKNIVRTTAPIDPEPQKPNPILKIVISDGSLNTDIAVLNRCESNEVTLVENGSVICKDKLSAEVNAWINSTKRQEELLLQKFVEYQAVKFAHHNSEDNFRRTLKSLQKKQNNHKMPAMKQGFMWFNAPTTGNKETTTVTTTTKKPFKDKNAEVFYFLALVLGVLGKYFWDHYEDRKAGKDSPFEPHLIVMSFIIAALVYYSIQQGLEKEANKFAIRGVVFAFNSGFMWQTILTSMNRTRVVQSKSVQDESITSL